VVVAVASIPLTPQHCVPLATVGVQSDSQAFVVPLHLLLLLMPDKLLFSKLAAVEAGAALMSTAMAMTTTLVDSAGKKEHSSPQI
jgi:hypothetical protein